MNDKQLLDLIDELLQDLEDMRASLADMTEEMDTLAKIMQDECQKK